MEQENIKEERVWNTIAVVITGIGVLLSGFLFFYVYRFGKIEWEWRDFCVTGFQLGIDRFRSLYAFLCALIWFFSVFVSGEYQKGGHSRRYYLGTLLTYFATIGIFYANHLVLIYILFEVMSMSSYLWVAQKQTKESKKASDLYLYISVISGLVMLMGVILLYCSLGDLTIGIMRMEALNYTGSKAILYTGAGCLLFGFATKAGAFPMHFYLHQAYPQAPAPAAAILSAALTKAGIFGILVLTGELWNQDLNWGMALVILGVLTMFWNAFLGIFQMNVMKILACSSVSQLGFIILGCGMISLLKEENALAVQGTILYMINHSLFKWILFLACGYLCEKAGTSHLKELAGTGRQYKMLFLPMLTACAGLAGIPLFSGYIAKTLLHESIVEFCHLQNGSLLFKGIEWIFLISGGMTLAYVSKIMFFIFGKKEPIGTAESLPGKISVSVYVPAVFSLVCGVFPYITMNPLSKLEENYYIQHQISYFSLENLKGALISIIIGTCIYFLLVRKFLSDEEKWPQWLSMEKIWVKPIFTKVLPDAGALLAKCLDGITPVLNQAAVLFMTGFAKGMDDCVPFFQRVGTIILIQAAKWCSSIGDFCILILQGTVFNSNKYIHLKKNANREIALQETFTTTRIIQASLSFGFLMVCLGLCVTLLYLLLG